MARFFYFAIFLICKLQSASFHRHVTKRSNRHDKVEIHKLGVFQAPTMGPQLMVEAKPFHSAALARGDALPAAVDDWKEGKRRPIESRS